MGISLPKEPVLVFEKCVDISFCIFFFHGLWPIIEKHGGSFGGFGSLSCFLYLFFGKLFAHVSIDMESGICGFWEDAECGA